MGVVFKSLLAVVFVVVVSLGGGVSAEIHHVGGDGGWGPHFNANAWLSGRLVTVGDKLRFEYSGEGDSIVEVGDAEEFETCNVKNPIKMLTDPVSHVALNEEGVRYFVSANPVSCRNGLKLPVTVQRSREQEPDPYKPDFPEPPYEPYHPEVPDPHYDPEPYKVPPPPYVPAFATRLDAATAALCLVLAAAAMCSVGI